MPAPMMAMRISIVSTQGVFNKLGWPQQGFNSHGRAPQATETSWRRVRDCRGGSQAGQCSASLFRELAAGRLRRELAADFACLRGCLRPCRCQRARPGRQNCVYSLGFAEHSGISRAANQKVSQFVSQSQTGHSEVLLLYSSLTTLRISVWSMGKRQAAEQFGPDLRHNLRSQ
jgi:hypothetical protein